MLHFRRIRPAWLIPFLIQPVVSAETIPAPRLDTVFPYGCRAGTDVEVTISGDALDGTQQLLFSRAGVTASPVMTQPDRFYPEPRPVPGKFVLHIGKDVPPGAYEVRATNRLGVSNARPFLVDTLPEILNTKANHKPKDATEINVNSVVNGTSEPQRQDFYRFEAKKGQGLVIHCCSHAADQRLDAVITLSDEQGKVLRTVHDAVRLEPTLAATIPADGQYLLSVHDFLWEGGSQFSYRLRVSTRPWIDFVDPPFVPWGEKTQYALYGHNLPDSQTTSRISEDGEPLEKLKVTIEAPDRASLIEPAVETLLRPADVSTDTFGYRLVTPDGASNLVRLGLIDGTCATEREPNDRPEQAQALMLPAQVIGRFQARNDRDWYTFKARKGQKLWIEVTSQRLGLPVDPEVLVQRVSHDGAGKTVVQDVAEMDDVARRGDDQDRRSQISEQDPAFAFTAPEDGIYRVLVRNLYGNGDPRLFYLLSIRPPRPDFALLAFAARLDPEKPQLAPHATTLRKGGSVAIDVLALRREGFDGEIRVTAEDLPPGVTCDPTVIGADSGVTPLVLHAAGDAPTWTGPIRIIGRATIDDADCVRLARPFEMTSVQPEGNDRPPMRVVRQFVLAVRDDVQPPFQLAVDSTKSFTAAPGGKISIPLTIKRAGGFKGEIRLDEQGLPPQVRVQQPVIVAPDVSEKTIELTVDRNCRRGRFSFVLRGAGQISYRRSLELATQAAEDKQRINAIFAADNKAMQEARQLRERSEAEARRTGEMLHQAEQRRAEAQRMKEEADAAAKAAADDPAKKDAAERAQQAAEALVKAVAAKDEAEKAVKSAEDSRKRAMQSEEAARQAAQQSEQAKRSAEERARQAEELSRPKDVRVVQQSLAILVEVMPWER